MLAILSSNSSFFPSPLLFRFFPGPDQKDHAGCHQRSARRGDPRDRRKGDIRFSYSPQLIPVDKKISVRAKKKTIEEIFELILKKNGIDYVLVEGQVVLKPHVTRTEKKETGLTGKIPDYTLSGYLKDKATGEVLIGANVYNQQTLAGTTTNAH